MRLVAVWILLLFTAGSAIAQQPYPQFRALSGLSGSGYGVNPDGYRSLSGPVAYSTPVAHTLGRGLWQVGGGTLSYTRMPAIDESRTNGTGYITAGITVNRVNIAGTYFIKSNAFDQVFHLQASYIPSPGAKWIASIGVQDVQGRGGAAGDGNATLDSLSSRSIFGVVTYRWDTRSNPIYISVGMGKHRFGRSFASMSYQIVQPLRFWLEADGYGWNFGIVGAWKMGHGRRSSEISTTLGVVRGQYFALSLGVGF
jgi:hypothetical protein